MPLLRESDRGSPGPARRPGTSLCPPATIPPPSPVTLSESASRSPDASPRPTWYTNSSVPVLFPEEYQAAAVSPASSASDAFGPATRTGTSNSTAIRTERPSPYAPSGSTALTFGGSNRSSSATTAPPPGAAPATNSRLPGPAAMDAGWPPRPPPAARPNSAANAPPGPNAWILPLPASATNMRPPGPTATPLGRSNCPGPAPAGSDALPTAARNAPSARYAWTRPAVPSSTAIVPFGPPAATPVMFENARPPGAPPAAPAPPNSSSLAPVAASNTRTLLSSEPTTSVPFGPAASARGSSPEPEPALNARALPEESTMVRLPCSACPLLKAATVPLGRTAIWPTDSSQPAAAIEDRAAPGPSPITSMTSSAASETYIPPGPAATCPGMPALRWALPSSSACERACR